MENVEKFDKDLIIVKEIIDLNYTEKNFDYQNLANINDRYLRSLALLFLARHDDQRSKSSFENDLKQYIELKKVFEDLENEEYKTNFIINEVDDNDMKLSFLSNIKMEENRKRVIESFKCEIDPEIEEIVILAQKMIREYFTDMVGENLTSDMKDVLEIVLNRTSVQLTNSLSRDNNGYTYYRSNIIHINDDWKHSIKKVIEVLIHEYGHQFSNFYFKTEGIRSIFVVEEGTQDLFSELVINHYLDKYENIELKGKKIPIKQPFVSWSGYNYENAFQRTILYPLEEKELVHQAIAQYQLGFKNDYYNMVFGNDFVRNMKKDSFGNLIMDMNINSAISDFYDFNFDCFQNIKKDSILYKRNWILPIYELQNIVYNDIELLGDVKVDCDIVANAYFGGRALHEISREELEEFERLYLSQQNYKIINYDNYANLMLENETDDQRKEFSYEILNNVTVLWNYGKELDNFGYDFYRQIACCCETESEKALNETSVECAKNYKNLISNLYSFIEGSEDNDSKEYLKDSIDNLREAYLCQIEKGLIDEKQRKAIIYSLYDSESEQFYMDDELLEIFERYGISFEFELFTREGKRGKSLSGRFILKQFSEGIAKKKERKRNSGYEEEMNLDNIKKTSDDDAR